VGPKVLGLGLKRPDERGESLVEGGALIESIQL